MSDTRELADWSDLPKDIYVVGAKSHGGIAFDVTCCSVPMVAAPEVRYTRADLANAAREAAERERDEWRSTAKLFEASGQEAARGLECLNEIDEAWDAFGTDGNRKALTLAEQIASRERELEAAEARAEKAEAETARKCAEIAERKAIEFLEKGQATRSHDMSIMAQAVLQAVSAISAAFNLEQKP